MGVGRKSAGSIFYSFFLSLRLSLQAWRLPPRLTPEASAMPLSVPPTCRDPPHDSTRLPGQLLAPLNDQARLSHTSTPLALTVSFLYLGCPPSSGLTLLILHNSVCGWPPPAP